MQHHISNKLNSYFISLLFCLIIYIPFFIGVFKVDKEISQIEKRTLSKPPELPVNIKDIEKFPTLFNRYYSDHFGLRDILTHYYKVFKYSIGDSPSEHVTIGKNGWLFLGSIKNGYTSYSDPIGDARNVNLYSQQELKKFALYINRISDWLAEKGIKYIFVIAPNKHTIYFDQLPDYISKVNERSAQDQLIDYLKKHSPVTFIDLREPLINAKQKHQLYYKTDTHWNAYGANIAQYEIMLEIEKMFPGKIQPKLQNFEDSILSRGDLANYIGIDSFAPDPQPIFTNTCQIRQQPLNIIGKMSHTLICDTQKLNAIIFGDSFFGALQPHFSRKFNRSTYIWGKLNYSALVKYIALEKPDIIIEEWLERELPYVPKISPEFNRAPNSHGLE